MVIIGYHVQCTVPNPKYVPQESTKHILSTAIMKYVLVREVLVSLKKMIVLFPTS